MASDLYQRMRELAKELDVKIVTAKAPEMTAEDLEMARGYSHKFPDPDDVMLSQLKIHDLMSLPALQSQARASHTMVLSVPLKEQLYGHLAFSKERANKTLPNLQYYDDSPRFTLKDLGWSPASRTQAEGRVLRMPPRPVAIIKLGSSVSQTSRNMREGRYTFKHKGRHTRAGSVLEAVKKRVTQRMQVAHDKFLADAIAPQNGAK